MARKEPSSLNNRTDIQKEEMSENSAIQEEEKHNFRNEHMNQANVMRGDKAKSGACASDVLREMDRDSHNVETSGSDTSSTRGKTFVGQVVNGDLLKSSAHIKGSGCQGVRNGEKAESLHFEEKQPRKRKRTIMNDYQIALMEKALLDEPEMQRNAAALQSWADKLSLNVCKNAPLNYLLCQLILFVSPGSPVLIIYLFIYLFCLISLIVFSRDQKLHLHS
jgi:hypothetical protein